MMASPIRTPFSASGRAAPARPEVTSRTSVLPDGRKFKTFDLHQVQSDAIGNLGTGAEDFLLGRRHSNYLHLLHDKHWELVGFVVPSSDHPKLFACRDRSASQSANLEQLR